MGIILSIVIGIVAMILGSVAVYRTNHPSSSGGGTLTNAKLIQPTVTRLIGSGSKPTIAISSGSTTTIAAPTLSARSSDMAGVVLSNGLNNSNLGFNVTVTFSSPYPTTPASVIVLTNNHDLIGHGGLSTVQWDTTGFTIVTADLDSPMNDQGGMVIFWTYIVIG